MNFPERFENLPLYAFSRLRELLEGVQPGGHEISMTIGEPRHSFPEWVTDIIVENALQSYILTAWQYVISENMKKKSFFTLILVVRMSH